MTDDTFLFRRFDVIGMADAEHDAAYLRECFIDTGELALLRDCRDGRSIIVGRTGSGKTALLARFREQIGERAIEIKPEALALAHISNSTILRFVDDLGVNLDPFFKLLWRHVFIVELIKVRFSLRSEDDKKTIVERIRNWFAGETDEQKRRKRALDYLDTHGPSFWIETELRTREVTQKLEASLETEMKAANIVEFGVTAASKLSEDARIDVTHRVQKIINSVQIRELSEVIDLIDGLLDDDQKPYFIVVDRLDDNWVEDGVRYKLIRALLDVAKDFFRVRNAKMVVAIRRDLIDRVFRLTRDPGYQEEKYRQLFVKLTWSKKQLTQVLDSRINALIRRRYTGASISHLDVLPDSIDGTPALDYIVKRSVMRPRDVIEFFNACISKAVDQSRLTAAQIKDAEGEYSRERLRSLADEWFADFPNLLRFADLLKKKPHRFKLGTISDDECVAFASAISREQISEDQLQTATWQMLDNGSWEPFRRNLANIFYLVGLVGLKLDSYDATAWITEGRAVSLAEIDDTTKVEIHPCFWRALGVRRD